jgi:hypothetical protein
VNGLIVSGRTQTPQVVQVLILRLTRVVIVGILASSSSRIAFVQGGSVRIDIVDLTFQLLIVVRWYWCWRNNLSCYSGGPCSCVHRDEGE